MRDHVHFLVEPFLGNSLARAFGPFLGGLAFDHAGHGSPYWIAGILMAVGALLAIGLPRRRQATP